MALYRNKVLVSGIRDYPAMTWAEYQALPVAQRPKKWICTDRDYTEIPFGAKNTITPSSYTSWSGYGGCYYRTRGTTVEINIALTGATGASATQIATLPAGARPTHYIGVPALSVNGNTVSAGGMYIGDDGKILVTSPSPYFIAHAYFETE